MKLLLVGIVLITFFINCSNTTNSEKQNIFYYSGNISDLPYKIDSVYKTNRVLAKGQVNLHGQWDTISVWQNDISPQDVLLVLDTIGTGYNGHYILKIDSEIIDSSWLSSFMIKFPEYSDWESIYNQENVDYGNNQVQFTFRIPPQYDSLVIPMDQTTLKGCQYKLTFIQPEK
jgi:hypothetical protein